MHRFPGDFLPKPPRKAEAAFGVRGGKISLGPQQPSVIQDGACHLETPGIQLGSIQGSFSCRPGWLFFSASIEQIHLTPKS